MKCDNCGNEFKNSLKCPLCGQRQGKISHCSVCDTIIHHGQSHCPKCGSPTKYAKHEDISKRYASKFIPTNYSKHSNDTHVYKQQEMYDYTSSNGEIKKRLEEARQKINNIDIIKKSSNLNEDKIKTIVITLLVIIVSAAIILSQVLGGSENGNEHGEIKDLEYMEVVGDNNNLANAGNYRHGAHVYLNNEDLYLGQNDVLKLTDRNFSNFKEIREGYGDSGIYVEDNYLYAANYDSYTQYDLNTSDYQEIFVGTNIIPLGNHRFIYTEPKTNGINLYADGQIVNLTTDRALNYAYDNTSGLVYYQYNQKIYVIDLTGQKIVSYDINCTGDMYVDGGEIYYVDYQGIKCYDAASNTIKMMIEEENIYEFIVSNKGIVYRNFDNEMYYYWFDEELYTFIDSDVSSFNVAGDLIIYIASGEDYYTDYWYVSDIYGNIAQL